MAQMTDKELSALLDSMVKDCLAFRDTDLMPNRVKAQEYYDGVMKDTEADEGRSSVVSRDLRSTIKKALPSIVRTILGSDKIVEYEPMAEGDEPMAEQATTFVNNVVLPESGGMDAIKDGIHDALLLRNGILKWWFEEKKRITETVSTGLDEIAFAQLVSSDDVTVLEHTQREEMIDGMSPEGQPMQQPTTVHDVRIRRVVTDRMPRVACIPLEEFLIHPDALSIETSPIVGHACRETRSDLVAIGYDRDQIAGLSTAEADDNDDQEKRARRDVEENTDTTDKSMEEVDYYELYVRVDYDDDGIAELRRICLAGGLSEDNILSNEVWDDTPFADVVCERCPHKWEGRSLFDDIGDIQRIKTVLLRGTLDNLYWQNNLQPIVEEGSLKDPSSVLNRDFGKPIVIKQGADANKAVRFAEVPFVAAQSFQMLGYLDESISDRTGVSDASSGLAPDALQNITAKASSMIEQAGIGQIEMIVRTIANGGIRRMFQGLLKMLVQHQDKPRTIRLSGKWVTFDPRTWNSGMDATVNTGLGAGTRERDMMMMNMIIGLQEKLLASFGATDNPYVTPDNLYNAISRNIEAAGLKTPEMYVTKPDPVKIKQLIDARANQPSPEQQKADAVKEIEKYKADLEMQRYDKEMQKEASKEQAQMEADLRVKLAEQEKDRQKAADKLAADGEQLAQKIAWEREKLDREEALEREKMDREDARAAQARDDEILKAEASAFERNLSGQGALV